MLLQSGVPGVLANPLVPLIVGIALVIVLLVKYRIPAFAGLVFTTFVVGIIAADVPIDEVGTVTAQNFGETMTSIGIPILMAAIVGKSLMESGAAERVTRAALSLSGEDHPEFALYGSGLTLAIPVFFSNILYVLAPIARSMRSRTGRDYVLYFVALSAGGTAAHALIVPTPGPLAVASELEVNLGLALGAGALVALLAATPSAILYGNFINNRLDIPLREVMGTDSESLGALSERSTEELPGLFESLLPILLAVVLVASQSVGSLFIEEGTTLARLTTLLGDGNVALSIAAVAAAATYYRMAELENDEFSEELTTALKDGGNIIAITAAGGAFGGMLAEAGVGQYIAEILTGVGIPLLINAWLISALIRTAQGSATVAMLTTAGIMQPLTSQLSVHPVYMLLAIGSGALVISWYNDSGFWLASEILGLTQIETLKTWTVAIATTGVLSIIVIFVLSRLFPLV